MTKPARIRFDDAIVYSSNAKMDGKEVQKFLKPIKWCINTGVPLTPAILCQDIEHFPEGIETLRQMSNEGIIQLDLHGWDHGPYGQRSQKEIEKHLELAQEWFLKRFETSPIRWITPHGADTEEIRAAAFKYDLIVESTAPPVIDHKILDHHLRTFRDLKLLEDRVIMVHWWNQGLHLYRTARIIEYGGIDEAIEGTLSELGEKDHRICWKRWMEE